MAITNGYYYTSKKLLQVTNHYYPFCSNLLLFSNLNAVVTTAKETDQEIKKGMIKSD